MRYMIENIDEVTILGVCACILAGHSMHWQQVNVNCHVEKQFDQVCHIKCSNYFTTVGERPFRPICFNLNTTTRSTKTMHPLDYVELLQLQAKSDQLGVSFSNPTSNTVPREEVVPHP